MLKLFLFYHIVLDWTRLCSPHIVPASNVHHYVPPHVPPHVPPDVPEAPDDGWRDRAGRVVTLPGLEARGELLSPCLAPLFPLSPTRWKKVDKNLALSVLTFYRDYRGC